jgi:hypothetical protein
MPARRSLLPERLRVGAVRVNGGAVLSASVPLAVNETKLAIVAVMQELDRPVSSIELQAIWAEHKDLKIFEYHLCTLVKAKVAEVVYGPELHFGLVRETQGDDPSVRERCR